MPPGDVRPVRRSYPDPPRESPRCEPRRFSLPVKKNAKTLGDSEESRPLAVHNAALYLYNQVSRGELRRADLAAADALQQVAQDDLGLRAGL